MHKNLDLQLTSEDARLLAENWEVHSDDWTEVEVGHELSVSKNRRAIELYVRMDVRELNKDRKYHNKTHIRSAKRWDIYKVPENDKRLIKSVESVQNHAVESDIFGGPLHDWFRFGDGVVVAMRDVKVHVDGRGGNDKEHQGLRGKIDFVVIMERDR